MHDSMIRAVYIAAPLVNFMVFTASNWLVYSMRIEGEAAFRIGFAAAGVAVGTFLGSIIAPRLTDKIPSGWLVICALTWMAVFFALLFLIANTLTMYFTITALAMLPSSMIGSSLFAHVFTRTDADAQGRVLGTFILFNSVATIAAPTTAAMAVRFSSIWIASITIVAGVVGIAILASSAQVRNLQALK